MKKITTAIATAVLAITLSSAPASASTGENAAMCGGGLFFAAQDAGDGHPGRALAGVGVSSWTCIRTLAALANFNTSGTSPINSGSIWSGKISLPFGTWDLR